MKHAGYLNDKDRADLRKADKWLKDGRHLRRQVLARLRIRARRDVKKGDADE